MVANVTDRVGGERFQAFRVFEDAVEVLARRGKEGDADVLRLEFDAWEGKLAAVLDRLAQEAMHDHGVLAVAMSHRIGAVGPNEPIVAIHVGSPHRAEAFSACSWLIDELKRQAPLWKKEVTSEGEQWKEGLG